MRFPTEVGEILARVQEIDPERYGRTRNFKDGAVSYLSPYISRGVLSTKYLMQHTLSLNLPFHKTEKFLQELAWRDYWQQIWIAKGSEIESDLRKEQFPVTHYNLPSAINHGNTGIDAIDEAIEQLYQTGYMHNHMRMYVAAISCNVGHFHWLQPARWLYAHLLDGDLASNHLSWQWVAGTNSNKKYYANQNNINKFFYSDQKNTFLDVEYSDFETLSIPKVLEANEDFNLKTILPSSTPKDLIQKQKTLIYNYYNLDPFWHESENYQRVLLLEPSFFETYPISQLCMDFFLELSKNISNIKIFVGSFDELTELIPAENISYKEHPTNLHYHGHQEPRDWMFQVTGYFPSFFAFWKKCKKELQLA